MSINFKRQMIKILTYVDKEVSKHKHDYCIKCILEITNKNIHAAANYYNRKEYYEVLKCNCCNSFIPLSKEGNISGNILNKDEIDESLPKIIASTNLKSPAYNFYDLYDVRIGD